MYHSSKPANQSARPRRSTLPIFGMMMAAASLNGCTTPDLGPRPALVDATALHSERSLSPAGQSQRWPADKWWHHYGDAQLDALVAEALAHSPTVAQAAARVRAAQGAMEQAGAATLPGIGANAATGKQKQSYNNGIPPSFVPKGWISHGDISLGANFDLDLWGKNKAQLAAATSDFTASQVDAQQARLILASNIVLSYADLARLYAEQDLLRREMTVREKSADLSAKRFEAGLDNRGPSDLARTQLAGTAGQLEANREQVALRRHALAALLGAGPDRGLSINRPDLSGFRPSPLPRNVGIALAGRRPDIVAARLRVEAQGRRIDAARADFLPDISLSALVGTMSLGLDKLFDSGSSYGNAQAAISLPIFDGGLRKGNLTRTRGDYDRLVAQYDATVIEALRQVADVVASRASAARQLTQADNAYAASKGAYDVSVRRFHAGLSNYLAALTAESAMIDAQRRVIDIHSRQVSLDVALVRALGGGFTDPTDNANFRSARP